MLTQYKAASLHLHITLFSGNAGDHVYKMNYQPFLQHQVQKGADLTIGAIPVQRGAEAAGQRACWKSTATTG